MNRSASSTMHSSLDQGVRRFVSLAQRERSLSRLLVLVVAVFALFSMLAPEYYLNSINFRTIGMAVPEIGLLSLAVMVSFLSGGIDLSIVSTAGLSSLTVAYLFQALTADGAGSVPASMVVLVIIAGLLVGGLAGLFNGFLISVVGITPILATLGTMTLYNGIAIVITRGEAVYGMPESFLQVGYDTLVGVPISFWVFIAAAILLAVVMNRTALGARIKLVGANPTAARFSGIGNRRVLILTYVTAGVLSGTAGVLMAARAASASADYGSSYLLLAIVIAILGGTNPSGGYGTVFGVVLAAITLQMVSSGFNIIRLSAFEYTIAQGAILVAVMVLDVLSTRRRARARPKAPRPQQSDAVPVPPR